MTDCNRCQECERALNPNSEYKVPLTPGHTDRPNPTADQRTDRFLTRGGGFRYSRGCRRGGAEGECGSDTGF